MKPPAPPISPVVLRLARLGILRDTTLAAFRRDAFAAVLPILFPPNHFATVPAISKWFCSAQAPNIHSSISPSHQRLNTTYLSPHGEIYVPIEATWRSKSTPTSPSATTFARQEMPLSIFLDYMSARDNNNNNNNNSDQTTAHSEPHLYLAQTSLSTLPPALRDDLPTSEIVLHAGRGDIYDSSIWLGFAPTYTPLHRDPNPNLFVQLAGRKVVRVFEPGVGAEMYNLARRKVDEATRGAEVSSGGGQAMRGEEMMQGAERDVLEKMVWDELLLNDKVEEWQEECRVIGYEAELGAGDGMYIPNGWWHSIKGVGDGIVGSVNWWFR